jgi:nicotinamide riboside transporter PnuC
MTETLFQVFTWSVTATALVGMVLNARMSRYGFVFWMVSNTCWIVVGLYTGVYAQSFQHVVYLYFSIFGFISWTKKQNERLKQRVQEEANPSSSH